MKITYLSRVDHLNCYSYEYDADDGTHVAGSTDIDMIKNHATTSRGDYPTKSEMQALEAAIKAEAWVS